MSANGKKVRKSPEFKDGDADKPKAATDSERSDSERDEKSDTEESDLEESSKLSKELEQKLKLSLEGKKKEKTSENPQSDALLQAVKKYEAMNEQVKLYMDNLEDKELKFMKGKLNKKTVHLTPGIEDTYKDSLENLGIYMAQDLYDKYKEGTVEEFMDWATKEKAEGGGGVQMQLKYCKAVIRGFALRKMKELMKN